MKARQAVVHGILVAWAWPCLGQSITTDHATYASGGTIEATWIDMAGIAGANSYVAVAYSGDPDDVHGIWRLTGSDAAGTIPLAPAPLGCNMEVRYYKNFFYEVVARSAPFDVDCGGSPPRVFTPKPRYRSGEDVEFRWTDATLLGHDWAAVAAVGAEPTDYIAWRYLYETVVGPAAFGRMYYSEMLFSSGVEHLPPGHYEIRYFRDDSYSLLSSQPFRVGLDPTGPEVVTTDRSSYTPSQPVQGCWSGTDGAPTNWIGSAPADAPGYDDGSYLDREGRVLFSLLPGPSGCVTLGCAAGCVGYEGVRTLGTHHMRLFAHGDFAAIAPQSPFTIDFRPAGAPGAGTVTPHALSFKAEEPIRVHHLGLPGNPHDVIALFDASYAPDDREGIRAWAYTFGAGDGHVDFPEGLPEGDYVARAMEDDSYTLLDEAPFAVVP
jgi:hypothetical protein